MTIHQYIDKKQNYYYPARNILRVTQTKYSLLIIKVIQYKLNF